LNIREIFQQQIAYKIDAFWLKFSSKAIKLAFHKNITANLDTTGGQLSQTPLGKAAIVRVGLALAFPREASKWRMLKIALQQNRIEKGKLARRLTERKTGNTYQRMLVPKEIPRLSRLSRQSKQQGSFVENKMLKPSDIMNQLSIEHRYKLHLTS